MSKQQSDGREIGGNLESYLSKPSPVGLNRRKKRRAELLRALIDAENECESLEAELRNAKERLNWFSWATRDLVEYLEAELSPRTFKHWQRLRRKMVRLKGV